MNENTVYGARFLEALDQLAGKAVFRYAERKAFREMDQAEVAQRVRPMGRDFFQQAKNGTPKELAELLAKTMKAPYVAETGIGGAEILSLMILN